jgi:hypothetical protein
MISIRKQIFNNLLFTIVAAIFCAGIIYAVATYHKVSRNGNSTYQTDSAYADSIYNDSIDREYLREDSIDSVRTDSIRMCHHKEYALLDTIICMSETIRGKVDKDYSGYYWQWLCRCNMQIGIYLREKGLYHGNLHYRDISAAIDSVDHFAGLYLGSDMSQSGMNCYCGTKWVLDFLRTMEVYQIIIHACHDKEVKRAWYQDYQNWYWTSEVLSYYYYQVFLGGDQGSGTESPMDVAETSMSASKLHRMWLLNDNWVLNGRKSMPLIKYKDVTRRDFENMKKKQLKCLIYPSDDKIQQNLDRERITEASDSLSHVLFRWIECRNRIERTITDNKKAKIYHHATQRIKWNIYALLNNKMDADKLMP